MAGASPLSTAVAARMQAARMSSPRDVSRNGAKVAASRDNAGTTR